MLTRLGALSFAQKSDVPEQTLDGSSKLLGFAIEDRASYLYNEVLAKEYLTSLQKIHYSFQQQRVKHEVYN